MGLTCRRPCMKATSRPKRKNDPVGARSRILDMAATLFQRHGYGATSMQDLMWAAGVSGGALHHHFASKKSLALAVILERVAPGVRETWIEPLRTVPSLQKAIAGIFGDIVEGIETRGRVTGCPLNNLALELALADPDFRATLDSVFAEWQAALVERIGATRGGARLNRAKRSDAAAFIVAEYSGAMTLAKTFQSVAPLRSAGRELAHWLRERDLHSS